MLAVNPNTTNTYDVTCTQIAMLKPGENRLAVMATIS
jgi:hypothetical protein